ncbi:MULTISPECIES: MBL fold metallo-hydrolase [Mycolicibacterium]|uniref:Predicted Zn-dependent hydrolase of beta-lactamase fold protein n=2 Tax=Mycolicibacterium gilvum TaxID=1804 RepID=E6TD22_MYCSR|nr:MULTISPECIES: MBL fold metallo-hydrolase [Mycolicibacterium]ABP45062.1 protein Pfam: Lactamase_B [Mycolicibacterium gilvum PYR-GCK]ADT98674.1 predicted Zn-dependent hydrolase of beta-lactamase fold protein [Mycolicibacterium gilvum Spyr1]MBV5243097.1 MBL fold metallo-hydrolase [Mycolicibacterium sp. PAM1]
MQIDVTFIGTATTLIRCGNITVLTDPNFLHRGQRAYLGYGLWSKRRRAPGLTPEELPPIDAIVLSHMHGDHWDRVAERSLDRELPVITTHEAAKALHRKGFTEAVGLSTWDPFVLTKDGETLTVTAMPGRHAPTPVSRLLPPVMGSMLDFDSGGGSSRRRVYISGDTLLIDELDEIPVRFNAIDAGVLHLGGTRLPFGDRLPVGLTVTMDGRQGAETVERLHLPRVIPVHFDDYRVFASPLADFHREMSRRGLADRVVTVERGQTVSL